MRAHPTNLRPVTLSVADHADIHTLFADGYGDSYKPHVVDYYLERATKIIGIADDIGNLAAAAVLRNTRIASAATAKNPRAGNRVSLGDQLMKFSRDEGAVWMSVGEQHRVVQLGAKAVGMERINDIPAVTMLLAQSDERQRYDIATCPIGNLLIALKDHRQTPYNQQIWAWPQA